MSACILQYGSFQARWAAENGGVGVVDVVEHDACRNHADMAVSMPLSLTSWSRAGRRADVSSMVLAAEAKKADGASRTTPRTPKHI
jgi:hypothetical protein